MTNWRAIVLLRVVSICGYVGVGGYLLSKNTLTANLVSAGCMSLAGWYAYDVYHDWRFWRRAEAIERWLAEGPKEPPVITITQEQLDELLAKDGK